MKPIQVAACAAILAGGACTAVEWTSDCGDLGESAVSRQGFLAAYPVFMHPRCMNCHPAGDAPLQGDDSHVHAQNVKRGPDGKGLFGMRCDTCHQDRNLPGANMPPGNSNWRLPSQAMPLVFEGRTPAQLARQLVDPAQNGGKSLDEILEHVTSDGLVLGGWTPGDGRSPPPMSHEDFVRAMRTWIEGGAPIPE